MAKSPILKRYMRAHEVTAYTGLHHDTLNRMVARGEMPRPVRLSNRVTMFDGVKIALRFSGVPTDTIELMSEEELMSLYQSGNHVLDQIDPEVSNEVENDDHKEGDV